MSRRYEAVTAECRSRMSGAAKPEAPIRAGFRLARDWPAVTSTMGSNGYELWGEPAS